MELLVLVLWVAPTAGRMPGARNNRLRRAARAATVDLVVGDAGLRRTLADGRVEETDWAEVMEVEVFPTRTGPHAAAGGVIMVGDGETRGCLVPLDQAASSGLIDYLCRLPGFDLNRFVEASQARPPTRPPVWRREPR